MCQIPDFILNQIKQQIIQADDFQIREIISAVISRYALLYPDDEIFFLSLPKNDTVARESILQTALALLQK